MTNQSKETLSVEFVEVIDELPSSRIESDGAAFNVIPCDDSDAPFVLVDSYLMLGEHYQTKLAFAFRLPPDKALELGEALVRHAERLAAASVEVVA